MVFEPFVTEWHYRIRPPVGFQARKLPADGVQTLGRRKLESEFKLAADGTVNATWRFDTVKRRYTPAETDALLAALRELKDAETQLIAFDQVGVALRAEGDFKGALHANDQLVAKYPRKAVHRLRAATALLEAGLGTRAQREALAATKLEPKSALAWKTLGWMLQHDAVGRRFGDGFDRAGALAAYHKARALEPENADISRGPGRAARARRQRRALFAQRRTWTKRSATTSCAARCSAKRTRRTTTTPTTCCYALLYAHRYARAARGAAQAAAGRSRSAR